MSRVVCMCGSRSLPSEFGLLIDRVISAQAGSGATIVVGCSAGADALVLERASALGCLAGVLAVGDSTGAGFWAGSGPFGLLQCLGRDRVRWLAGGPLPVPLPVRLAERTRACIRWAASSGPRTRLIAFPSMPECPDTLFACRYAASLKLTVIVFPCGFAAVELVPLVPGGEWVPAGTGVWSDAVLWSEVKGQKSEVRALTSDF